MIATTKNIFSNHRTRELRGASLFKERGEIEIFSNKNGTFFLSMLSRLQ